MECEECGAIFHEPHAAKLAELHTLLMHGTIEEVMEKTSSERVEYYKQYAKYLTPEEMEYLINHGGWVRGYYIRTGLWRKYRRKE